MIDKQRAMLAALKRCTFGVGSTEKRFVRDLGGCKPDRELSERQDWYLRRTYYRYRRQIGHKDAKPADYDTPPVKQTTLRELEREGDSLRAYLRPSAEERRLARERAQLDAWNTGKARRP